MPAADPPARPQTTLDDVLGLEYLPGGDGTARARVPIRDEVRQPYGIVHGGAISAIAESVCSRATYEAVKDDGMIAMGQSNLANFLRPLTDGHINCVATARHRGRTTWVWDCEITDDDGRLCALVRMTTAVRPRRSSSDPAPPDAGRPGSP